MKKLILLAVLAYMSMAISCKKEISGINQSSENLTEIKPDYLAIKQIDYSRILITSSEHLTTSRPLIKDIKITSANDSTFSIDTLQAFSVLKHNQKYLYNFQYELKIDQHLINFRLHLQFDLTDGSFLEYDSTINMLKFPYASTEVFLNWADLPENGVSDVQDFEIDHRYLFYHPYGAAGTYQFDLNTHQVNLILDYGGGDFLAYDADSGYVFMDVYHDEIWKHDLKKDTSFILYSFYPEGKDIKGMTARAGSLFVVCQDWQHQQPQQMFIFNYSGQLLKQFDVNVRPIYQLDIYKDSFLTWPYLHSYDLHFQDEKDIPPPTANTEALSILEPYLYFSDYDKKIIGRTLLSEIFSDSTSSMAKLTSIKEFTLKHEQKDLRHDYLLNSFR